MKKNIYLLLTILCVGILSSCSKDDDNDKGLEEWKLKNEQALDNLDKSIYKAIETSNGTLYYKVLTKGEGKKLDANSRVSTYYRGYFYNGIAFDGNVSDKWEPLGKPFKVALSAAVANNEYNDQVIKGWTAALQAMSVGDKWEVWLPYTLAYGVYGNRSIPGYSTLVFEMEAVDVAE